MSDEKDPALPTTTSPPKYSRYRSVRHAVKKEEPLPEQSPEPEMARTKSMSRYRRTRPIPTRQHTPPMPLAPPVPRATSQALCSNPPVQRDVTRRVTAPMQIPQSQKRPSLNNPGRPRPQETDDERMRRMGREAHEREEQRRKARKEQEERDRIARQQKEEQERITRQQKEAEETELARKIEEDSAKRLAEQKRKDLERLQAELDAAVPISPPPTTSPRERLRFFSRKKAQVPTSPLPIAKREHESTLSSTTRSSEPPRGIEQGGGGIVPQIDAPRSASNAGERVSYVCEFSVSKLLRIYPESSHPMQAILDKSSNYSRNYTYRYHSFCCKYHDAKYHPFHSRFTRIICAPWP
jgi:hypothetical protein